MKEYKKLNPYDYETRYDEIEGVLYVRKINGKFTDKEKNRLALQNTIRNLRIKFIDH